MVKRAGNEDENGVRGYVTYLQLLWSIKEEISQDYKI